MTTSFYLEEYEYLKYGFVSMISTIDSLPGSNVD